MSEGFIRTERGVLNLRHVRRIYEEQSPKGWKRHTAVLDNGQEYDVNLGNETLDNLCLRIVPAGPDDRACLLSINPGDLTAEGVWEQHLKIVAWGISTNYAGGSYGVTPILSDSRSSNQIELIRCPDGSWLRQEDEQYATLEEAKRAVFEEHVAAEERKERLKEADNAGH